MQKAKHRLDLSKRRWDSNSNSHPYVIGSADSAPGHTCNSTNVPSLNALGAAITAMARPADMGSNFGRAGSTCRFGLHNFAANAVDINGNTVNAIQFSSQIGLAMLGHWER